MTTNVSFKIQILWHLNDWSWRLSFFICKLGRATVGKINANVCVFLTNFTKLNMFLEEPVLSWQRGVKRAFTGGKNSVSRTLKQWRKPWWLSKVKVSRNHISYLCCRSGPFSPVVPRTLLCPLSGSESLAPLPVHAGTWSLLTKDSGWRRWDQLGGWNRQHVAGRGGAR